MLVADGLQHAGVGREAGLAAALARQAELLEEHRAELLGRADDELLVGQRPDLALEAVDLVAHALVDLGQALAVEAHAGDLHVAQHAHERQLDLGHQRLEAAVVQLLALPGGERLQDDGVGPGLVVDVGGQPALLADLAEREAAARGLEQVGGQHRVVGQAGRHDAELLGVVGDDGPIAERRDELLGALARAHEHVLARGHAEAPVGVGRDELALRGLGRDDRDRDLLAALEARDVGQRARAHAGLDRDLRDGRGRRAVVALAEGLLQARERSAQLELAEDLAQARAVGLARGLGHRVDLDRHVELDRRQLLRQARVVGVRGQVLLALGAGDVVDVGEDLLERAEALQQLGGRLVADPGNAGDVVRRVALQAVEVGDQLRGDPVAVDDRLVVVDLGVGDAAPGGHDLHARLGVDDLEGVAVAGDDHDRHPGVARAIGDGGDDVVGLEAVDRDVAIAEGVDERLEVRPLLLEQVGPRPARRLVVRRDLLAPRGARVPDDDRRLGPVLGQQLHEHRGEAEDRVGGKAGRGGDRLGQGEERAVGKRVAVDQEELVVPVGRHAPHATRSARDGAGPTPQTARLGP